MAAEYGQPSGYKSPSQILDEMAERGKAEAEERSGREPKPSKYGPQPGWKNSSMGRGGGSAGDGPLAVAKLLAESGDDSALRSLMFTKGLLGQAGYHGIGSVAKRQIADHTALAATGGGKEAGYHLRRPSQGGSSPQARSGSGGIGGMQAPQQSGKQSQAQLDLADFYERRRARAGQQDQLKFRQQIMNMFNGGNGGGQVRESGMKEDLFNNAGRPQAVPLQYNSTRDITPQERAALISAMLQGM